MKKAIVLLSGGLDSTTTLYYAIDRGFSVHALSFDYGQKHKIELELARKIAQKGGATQHTIASIDRTLFSGSALTDINVAVPRNRKIDEEIPVTYVPARNLLFLAHAASLAESTGASHIFIGANAVDYSGYPDCRPVFLKSFEETMNLGTKQGAEGGKIFVEAPLVDLSKEEIIKLGLSMGVDYSITSSCYSPAPNGNPCGQCDSCQIRKAGFEKAGFTDPLHYN